MATTTMIVRRTLAGLLLLAVLGFLAWGLWQAFQPQVLPLQGQMDAQEINISSKVPGRVGRVLVKPGQSVQAGEVVFELDSPEVQAKLTQAHAAQDAAQAVAGKARNGARPEELQMARMNFERAQTAERIAQTTYERVQAMLEQGPKTRLRPPPRRARWRAWWRRPRWRSPKPTSAPLRRARSARCRSSPANWRRRASPW
jgi:HlyD family secretion protein